MKDKSNNNNRKVDDYGCREETGDNISIIVWNTFTIYTTSRQFILNSYLSKHKPDFVLLNEIGIKGDSALNLHEDYNIIEHNAFTGIIYKRELN